MKELKLKKLKTTKNYSTIIYTVCSYCGVYMGTKNGIGISGISHGICEKCFNKAINELK